MKRSLWIASLLCLTTLATGLIAQEADKPRILFLTQSEGFVHSSVKRSEGTRSPAELAMMQLAKDSGAFSVICTQDAAADITRETLQKFDIVAFYTSGDLPIADQEMEYLLKEWLPQAGHGFIGFHSATDTYKNFEPYWDLIGGTFAGHPWGQDSHVTIAVHDTEHPAMKPYGSSFETQDEIYQYDHWQPEKVHLLMSLDMQHTALKRPYLVPVAWCKEVGDGKLFYTNLGHRESTWKDQRFLDSIVGAVRWIDGQVAASAKPNPEVSAAQHALSQKHAGQAGTSK